MTNLRLIATAVGALCVGVGIGYKVAERKLGAEFDERLERETNQLRRMYKPGHETPEEMVQELYGDAVDVMREYNGESREPVAYEKIRTSTVKVEKADEEPAKTHRVFEVNEERGEIYVITGKEFEQNEPGYEQLTLSYYAKDGVIADIHEDRMEDYERYIGKNALTSFGEKNDDENVVHVRNEIIMLDYEIIRSSGSYCNEVLGEEDAPPERPSQRIQRGG